MFVVALGPGDLEGGTAVLKGDTEEAARPCLLICRASVPFPQFRIFLMFFFW